MVEQRPFKPLVGGSSPPAPTTVFLRLSINTVPILQLPNCVLLNYCLIFRTASDKFWFYFGSLTFGVTITIFSWLRKVIASKRSSLAS